MYFVLSRLESDRAILKSCHLVFPGCFVVFEVAWRGEVNNRWCVVWQGFLRVGYKFFYLLGRVVF